MSGALKQLAYAFSPFTKAAGSTVTSVNGLVSKSLEKNGQYVVQGDKEYMELPLKFFYSTLARYAWLTDGSISVHYQCPFFLPETH